MSGSLEQAAREAQERAHAPYSGYSVGAALETDDGRVFSGCNVENASFSITCCAERVALFSAVAAGARSFRRIAIAASGRTPYPCGACRQALTEFAPDLEITVVDSDDVSHSFTLAGLLPRPFRFDDGGATS